MYFGTQPTLVGNFDGFNTGFYNSTKGLQLVNNDQLATYLGSTKQGTFYAHAFGYPFTSTASNATFNVLGEDFDVTGKLFSGDTTFGTVNLNTTHGATVNRTYIAQIDGNLTINGTVTVGTQVRGCVFAVNGNITMSSGSVVATDYGSSDYTPAQDWHLVRSDLNSTHSIAHDHTSSVRQLYIGNRGASGFDGNAGANGRAGGGGAGGVWNGNTSVKYGSVGAKGAMFAGGAGGGASVDGTGPDAAGNFGGDGGNANGSSGSGWGGGAGNPAGTGTMGASNGGFGVGGNVTFIATGDISIDSGSSIVSNGSNGGNSNNGSSGGFSAGGGASGGGSFIAFCGGSYSNSGSITLNGGTGGTDVHSTSTSPSGDRGGHGGDGGAGSSVTVASINFRGV